MKTTISTLNSGEYQVEINVKNNAHGENAVNNAFSKGLRFSSCLLRSDDSRGISFRIIVHSRGHFFLRKKYDKGLS